MDRVLQLKIDLKYKDISGVYAFYNAICKLNNNSEFDIEIMNDGNAPYIEDMTEQYEKLNKECSMEEHRIWIKNWVINIDGKTVQKQGSAVNYNYIVYDDGAIRYDFPERVPLYVREKVKRHYRLPLNILKGTA